MKVFSMRQPGALLPLAMLFATLAIALGHAAMLGFIHEAEEGTTARISSATHGCTDAGHGVPRNLMAATNFTPDTRRDL